MSRTEILERPLVVTRLVGHDGGATYARVAWPTGGATVYIVALETGRTLSLWQGHVEGARVGGGEAPMIRLTFTLGHLRRRAGAIGAPLPVAPPAKPKRRGVR